MELNITEINCIIQTLNESVHMFGNNFFEYDREFRKKVIKKLQEHLSEINVEIN